jgi:hypothetical protein
VQSRVQIVGYLAGFTEICPRGSSLRARQGATPDAYDARATRIGPVHCGSLSARADRASRFHPDAIDAADAHIVDIQYGATDAIWTHNTPNLEHPPRARRRPFQMLERLRRRRASRSIRSPARLREAHQPSITSIWNGRPQAVADHAHGQRDAT